MKNLFRMSALAMSILLVASCGNNTKKNNNVSDNISDSIVADAILDTTVYGVVGEASSMHSLQLITDAGDTISYLFDVDDDSNPVQGGILAGDRMAVISKKNVDGEDEIVKAINLTSLIGRWTSIDKNFEILEGGVVKSNVKAEKHPWVSWKIFNGHLILNADTFDVDNLGADSLYLENKEGVFVYKRAK